MGRRDDWRPVHGPSCPIVPVPPSTPVGTAVSTELLRTERGEDGVEVRHDVRLRAVDVPDGGAPPRSLRLARRGPVGRRTRSPLAADGRGRRVRGPVRRLGGTTAALDLRGRGATFGHWMIDALPNLWLLERAGEPLDAVDAFLVPARTAWVLASLAAVGIGPERVVAADEAGGFDVERLLLPVRSVGSRRVPWWTVRGLTLDGRVTVAPDPALPSAVYVRRGSAGRRGVADEERVAAHLGRRGIASVDPGDADLLVQRRRFASADLIVAAHGAALSSVAWCRPGATLVELMPTVRPNALFLNLAHQAGVRYSALPCPPADGADGVHGDIGVDLAALDVVLAAVGDPHGDPT